MVRVPVELSEGGPLSTTRMGRKYTFCSWRLKPDRCVWMPAVLSEWDQREKAEALRMSGERLEEQIFRNVVVIEQRNM